MQIKIWASLSDETSMGVILWEIFEVEDSESNKYIPASNFVECRDRSLILPSSYHFWTRKQALDFIAAEYQPSRYFDYELVGEK